MNSRYLFVSLVAVLALAMPMAAIAQGFDIPTVTVVRTSETSVTLDIQAGASGAPAGLWVDWMSRADYDAFGGFEGTGGYLVTCIFNGTATLNTEMGSAYILGANEIVRIEIGDLFDETGVFASDKSELSPGEEYVLRTYANSDGETAASPWTPALFFSTQEEEEDCVFTQGYWKNHPQSWPQDVIDNGLDLGNVNYSMAELMDIFNTPANGNGLIFLAHQLIAAKLNILTGAIAAPIQAAVDAADALIGNLVVPPVGGGYIDPSNASDLTEELDQYNNGTIPGSCGPVAVEAVSWGTLKGTFKN